VFFLIIFLVRLVHITAVIHFDPFCHVALKWMLAGRICPFGSTRVFAPIFFAPGFTEELFL
jgi:hypothetical protein